MQRILVYDDTEKELEKASEKLDMSIAGIIEALVSDYLDEFVNENE